VNRVPPQAAGSDRGETRHVSACTPNCWMTCRLYAHVRDGRLVRTSPAPFPDPRYDRICLRGLSHPQRVHSPERITKPLLRTGRRGEDRWREIPWDEALDLVAGRLADVRRRHGSRAVLFVPVSGNHAILNGSLAGSTHRFANLFDGTLACERIDMGLVTGQTQVLANLRSGDAAWYLAHQPEDIANARTIVAWGSNVTETQLHNWHFFADALEAGAKLVCIDPRYSETAAKAHLWLRPRPGTDAALGLGMIDVVIEEGLCDLAYVREHTVGPFLVRSDDGRFLRAQDLPGGEGEAFLGLDPSSGAIRPLDDMVAAPALRGSCRVRLAGGEEISLRPAFDLLAEEAARLSPERSAAITGVDPAALREVARLYATNGPAFIYTGMGIDHWDNADLVGRATATLAVLCRQIGRPGASPLIPLLGGTATAVAFESGALKAWAEPTGRPTARLNRLLAYDAIARGAYTGWRLREGQGACADLEGPEPQDIPCTIKAAVFAGGNFVSNFPNQRRVMGELFREDRLEFAVDLEMFMNDTARMCDLVLPITSWFENDDLVAGFHPFLMRQERAIAPVGESRSDFDIYRALAERLGWGAEWRESPGEWIDRIVRAIALHLGAPRVEEEMRSSGVARLVPPGRIPLQDGVFPTHTGRAEFYAEGVVVNWPPAEPAPRLPVEWGVNPLPHYEPPFEASRDNPLFARYPLVLHQRHARWRVHTTFAEVPVLREMDPEPLAELNEREMRRRGLADGDLVRVFNDRGDVVLKVRTNNGYPDGVCNVSKGWQRRQFVRGGYQELTSDHVNLRHFNCSFFDVLVEVEAWTGQGPGRTPDARSRRPGGGR